MSSNTHCVVLLLDVASSDILKFTVPIVQNNLLLRKEGRKDLFPLPLPPLPLNSNFHVEEKECFRKRNFIHLFSSQIVCLFACLFIVLCTSIWPHNHAQL